VRTFRVCITYPDLPSAHAEFTVRIEAGNLRVAVGRALYMVSKDAGLKRRHLRQVHVHARVEATATVPPAAATAGA